MKKILSIAGLICFLVPLSLLVLWIFAFNQGTDQTERLKIFNKYVPGPSLNGITYALITLFSSVLAVIFNSISIRFPSSAASKNMAIILVVCSSLLLLLNLFQMM